MVGFTEMGDLNEEFRSFKERVENRSESEDVNDDEEFNRSFATHVIVYMARGIFTNLAYPFGYFFSTGFTAAQLYPCTMEATRVLTAIGFRVCVFVSDGAFIKIRKMLQEKRKMASLSFKGQQWRWRLIRVLWRPQTLDTSLLIVFCR